MAAHRATRWIGRWLIGVAALHILVAGFQYREVLLTVLKRGVVNTVAGDPTVGAVVWSMLFGALAGIGGLAVSELEASSRPLAKLLGWSLLALAVAGCVLVPVSGFWLLFPPAIAILARKPKPSPGKMESNPSEKPTPAVKSKAR